MTKKRTQKVRFHKGDKRPPKTMRKKLSYSTEMSKEGKKIIWNVVEHPTGNIVGKYFFEEDARKLAEFQDKHKVWQVNGGIPKMFWNYIAAGHIE
tara:strand:+ start:13 stop:297 length:285 start_codon:yes stop_codon:yes gene_type:complete